MDSNELLRRLGRDSGLSQSELRKIALSAPFRYKHYTLKKRSGGVRDIYHPTPELKAIQWWISTNVISRLPVHECVFSYQKGRGIRDHAAAHLGSRYFLRLDFSDFFPSIKYSDVCDLLRNGCSSGELNLDEAAIALVARLVCRAPIRRAPKGRKTNPETLALSIGAPSSPAISNAMLFDLDCKISKLCEEVGVRYTRYADDLYFSTQRPNTLHQLKSTIESEIAAHRSPRLIINDTKTSHASRKYRVQVTGVVITPEGGLSVGRANKRRVKALLHKYIAGLLAPEDRSSLRGMIAFVASIEPNFIERLRSKYGDQKIEDVMPGKPKT